MRNRNTWVLLGMLGLSYAAWANTSSSSVASLNQQSLTQQHTQVNAVQADKTRQLAAQWGLTVEDWHQYEEIMKGPRGIWSPGLDPLTALGVEATSEAEQIRIARIMAKIEHDRAEKEVGFSKVYNQEFAKMYPNEKMFKVEPHVSQADGRVIYFTRLDNCNTCNGDLQRILKYASPKTPVDIFVVGDKITPERIQEWARANHIPAFKLSQKALTLNLDQGYWFKYSFGKMPAAYQVQGDGQWNALVY